MMRKITSLLVLAVVVMLFSTSCGNSNKVVANNSDPTGGGIGIFEVGQEREEDKPKEDQKNGSIQFSGYNNYSISKSHPLLKLSNSAENHVNFVYEIKDETTGEVLAKTEAVAPGDLIRVNMYEKFQKIGTYNLLISIYPYDIETGTQVNGVDQKLELRILEDEEFEDLISK